MLNRIYIPYTTKRVTNEMVYNATIRGATKPKPKRTPLTQRLGAWAMRCFDAWLQGGKRWDWGDGK